MPLVYFYPIDTYMCELVRPEFNSCKLIVIPKLSFKRIYIYPYQQCASSFQGSSFTKKTLHLSILVRTSFSRCAE